MTLTAIEAFQAESERLTQIAAEPDDTAFAQPTPCTPWTVAELLYHVRMTMARLTDMLAAPEPSGSTLVAAPGYYRADQRFSAVVNDDRIQSAQRGAAALSDAAARARDFSQTAEHALSLLRSAPPGRVVLTRHGDRMLLTEFTRTRVLELAVHGLDLAAALDRAPWMTAQAARVTGELLLPSPSPGTEAELRAAAGWDPVTLVAKLTGRTPTAPAEAALIASLEVQPLALG